MTPTAAHEYYQGSRTKYLLTFAALMVLLIATVIAAHFPLGVLAPLVALGIATLKLILIAIIFMHLQEEPTLVRIFAAAGLCWLAILFALLASDYGTRHTVLPAARNLPANQPAPVPPIAR